MRDVTEKIILDLDRKTMNHSVSMKLGDTKTRELCITLKNCGVVYPLDGTLFAIIKAIKPDGTKVYNDCVIRGNEIRYTVKNQVIAMEGVVTCELELYGSDGSLLTSPQFYIEVYKDLFSDNVVESENEYSGIQEALKICQEAQSASCDAKVAAENAKDAAEESKDLAADSALLSKSYAVGTDNVYRSGDKQDNARAYKEATEKLTKEVNDRFAVIDQYYQDISEWNADISDAVQNAVDAAERAEDASYKAEIYADQVILATESAKNARDQAEEYEKKAEVFCNVAEQYRDQIQIIVESEHAAAEELYRKLQFGNFSLSEDGILMYEDDSTYRFLVNDDGCLEWEVA